MFSLILRKNPLFLVLVVFLFISGCQTLNVKEDFELDPDAGTGLIIGSVTQTIKAGRNVSAAFFLNRVSGKNVRDIQAKVKTIVLGDLTFKSEFEEQQQDGRIFAVEVPAGINELDAWEIKIAAGYIYPRTPPPSLKFSVKPGEVVYIGNLHMDVDSAKNFLGIKGAIGGAPSISDEQERDIPLLKEKFKNLATKDISINVLHEGVWIDEEKVDDELEIPLGE
ncbi:MAG: hypothetical protein COB61_004725 [Thiotrichales bacterium]|nr:hypothetical protein [Thiotrichales bacterium]